MKPKRVFSFALGALTLSIAAVTAKADEAITIAQLIRPSSYRLIPTTFPLVRPDYSKLTANSSHLTRTRFDRLIQSNFPVIIADFSRLKVMNYEVAIPGATHLHRETKSPLQTIAIAAYGQSFSVASAHP